ncbi:MAG: TIGR02530 family flagellar biosynthesis protein [Armatimonadota bacterium]|nr:hypothetical protein [bacterium]
MSPVRFTPVTTGVQNTTQTQTSAKQAQGSSSFASELQSEVTKQSGVTLSAHAQKRLAERNVQLGPDEQARLGVGMDNLQQKGADKSLVLLDNLALVVSARNRTVITAVDSTNAKDSVFTNIDSAVIV